MNPLDILRYGHQTLMAALGRVPETEWDTGRVCGYWTAREVLAHLSAYELWHDEVLGTFLGISPGPMMSAHEAGDFNDQQVALRHGIEVQALLAEYQAAHTLLMKRAGELPNADFTRVGSLPWYGVEYSLDDFLVYSSYGHKREHSAQLNVFTDQFSPTR